MDRTIPYSVRDFAAALPAADYVARFRDADRIGGYCRACGNYGRCWACPPFEPGAERCLTRYRTALLIATRIVPRQRGLPMAEAGRLIRPERRRIEDRLSAMERRYGGRSFAYAGTCLYCPEGTCTRPEGSPCRHPDRVRPSLEAFGFDIGRTTAELFGFELQWGRDGRLPESLTLVSGFFHDGAAIAWDDAL